MQQIFVTRRNLLALLSKLDRAKAGEYTACTIIKKDTVHPTHPATAPFGFTALEDDVTVTAVEDADYYTDRAPGEVLPVDVPR